MHTVGKVYKLFITQKGINDPIEKKTIIVDPRGIVGDKHYGTPAERTVLITSLDSYMLAEEQLSVKMPHGYLGENLLVDYNPYHLPAGSCLRIGSAIFEITQNCTLCNHLSKLDKRIPKLLKDDRGVFAKVVEGGKVETGDPISLLD